MCSDSEMKMSAYADQNHAPSLTCVRLEKDKNVALSGAAFFDENLADGLLWHCKNME